MAYIKFTEDRREEILRAKRLGASNQTAARAGGIDPDTLRAWLQKGKDTPEGAYGDFVAAFDAAEATPNIRALEIVNKAMSDKPELAWKFLERKERGYAPPMPQAPSRANVPVVVTLSLGGAMPPVNATDIEVMDAEESPALGDGSSDRAPSDAP